VTNLWEGPAELLEDEERDVFDCEFFREDIWGRRRWETVFNVQRVMFTFVREGHIGLPYLRHPAEEGFFFAGEAA
jgi:hypothetical protein